MSGGNAFLDFLSNTAGGFVEGIGQGQSLNEAVRSAAAAAQTHMQGGAARQAPGQQELFDPFAQELFDPFAGQQELFDPFAQIFAQFEQAFEQQIQQDDEARQPATSQEALHALPRVKITPKDLQNEENSECSICLDKFQVDEFATRVPCGHFFHEGCVKKWLQTSNQCPICRYELPSDDVSYEAKRRRTMHERKLRLRLNDLSARSSRELRHLANVLKVDLSGCLEKDDIVQRIAASGSVDIAPEDKDCAHATPSKDELTMMHFKSMRVGELKSEMQRLGISSEGCLEKHELLERIASSGHVAA